MDPASDFNMFIFLLAFEAVSLACWLKVCMVSKVTPRSLGCFSRGTSRFLILIWGWILASWQSGVKRVTVDFSGETNSSLSSRKSVTLSTSSSSSSSSSSPLDHLDVRNFIHSDSKIANSYIKMTVVLRCA